MNPLAILGSGMVTSVGFNAAACCAAIRVGISGAAETRFMFDGEWLMGAAVPFEPGWRGRAKLLRMAVPAIQECLNRIGNTPAAQVPLFLCVAEPNRPGRFAGLDDSFLHDVHERLDYPAHPDSKIIAGGRIGPVHALIQADKLITAGLSYCVIAGVDTLLTGPTLAHYHQGRRLLTTDNSNGFIPGEAACAVVLGSVQEATDAAVAITGVGFGEESAPINSEEPLRADGLTAAIKTAVADAGVTYAQMAYRVTDNSGEQYGFKEAALAVARTLRAVKPEFDIEHPADCIGEVGTAMVPAMIAVADMAERKRYAPGRHMGDVILGQTAALEGSERAAFIMRSVTALHNSEGRVA